MADVPTTPPALSRVNPDSVYDWCAAYSRLRDAYQTVISGGTVRKVRFHNAGEERETDFEPGNAEELRMAMVQARENCAKQCNGGRGTRFAMQGGQTFAPLRGRGGWC